VALTVLEWRELIWFQPDLTSWLAAVARLVTLTGGDATVADTKCHVAREFALTGVAVGPALAPR
jgi:hypothetical protein